MSGVNEKENKLNIANAIFSAACVLVLFVTVSVLAHITPFGDRTFLMFDLKRQYVDYYAYLRTILTGENNVFYSFSMTLGSGILGFFAYYLTSPFLLVLSCFKRENLTVGVSVVICLKLMLAAFNMNIYLQKMQGPIHSFSIFDTGNIAAALGAISYSLSGYLFVYSINMMWMDVIVLFPLLMITVEFILDYNKKLPFILLLFYMLYLNYYITYQVILFTALWTIMRVIVRRDDGCALKVFRVLYSGMIAGAMSAFLMLPTALQLMNSPKDIGKLGLAATEKNLSIIDIMSKLPTLSYDYDEIFFGYPQIYCGVLLSILVLMYFMSMRVTRREKIGMFTLFIIFIVSFSSDALDLFWHAGMEPSGYPYRQSYLWVFMVCICASRALLYIREEMNGTRLMVILSILISGLLFINRGEYDHISRITIVANVSLIILYAFCFILMLQKKSTGIKELALKYLVLLLFVVNCADLTANALYTYRILAWGSEDQSVYRQKVGSVLDAVSYVKDNDDSFYRMEDLDPRQQNDGLMFAYNGITHYSSAGKIYVRYFLQRLGFNEDRLLTHYGHDNTVAADSLLGVKYVISDDAFMVHPSYEKIFDGAESVYQNPGALSVAIGSDSFELQGISDTEKNSADFRMSHVPVGDPFFLQESIFENLLGRQVSIFADADVTGSGLQKDGDEYYIDYDAVAAADGELFFYLDGLIGAYENLSVYLDGEFLTTYGNASCVKILDLGIRNKGDRISVRVVGESSDADFGTARFVTEDTGELFRICYEIGKNNCDVEKISSSHLLINAGDVKGVLVTIPYEKGWQIKDGGKTIKPVVVYDSLMYLPLEDTGAGHIIDMKYVPEGLFAGIAVSIIGLLALVIVILAERKQKKENLK